jgi:hypothetical protein
VEDGDVAEIGYFDMYTSEFIKIDETLAWNWQQGSQLQWLPPSFDDEIIYNTIENNRFVSVIYSIRHNKRRVLQFPIYAVHPLGNEAIGVQYERHYWCRPGYNYQNIRDEKWNKRVHEEDGLFRINIQSGEVERIVSLSDIVNHKKLSEFDTCSHWLEHIMYSPNGKRFMFFHRWRMQNKDLSRVYTANSSGAVDVFMYPDNRFYSHYYWKDNTTLSIWTNINISKNKELGDSIYKIRKNEALLKLLSPVYKLVKSFLPKTITSAVNQESKLVNFADQTEFYTVIGNDMLRGNGHQSWFTNQNKILNDTYQDKQKFRHLMIFDNDSQDIFSVGKFYSKYNDSVFRCDLHPKLSIDNKFIVIDSAHTDKRKIMILEKR